MGIPERLKPDYRGWQTKPYSDNFVDMISAAVKRISKDDDFLLMCVGETGSGKSVLTLHGYELVDPENCSIDFISFCPEDHAKGMKDLMQKKEGVRFIANDEANIQKRNSSTKYNKDLIDLYFSIRGLNFFHWWNNPSLDIIDKVFIREKINGVIYIMNKDIKYPRLFSYFTKEAMLKIIDEHKIITLDILKKNVAKHALAVGWFRDYQGKLLKDYKAKKKSRMENKVDDFFDKYAAKASDIKTHTRAHIARELHTNTNKLNGIIEKLKCKNEWIEMEDYIKSFNNVLITDAGFHKLKELCFG